MQCHQTTVSWEIRVGLFSLGWGRINASYPESWFIDPWLSFFSSSFRYITWTRKLIDYHIASHVQRSWVPGGMTNNPINVVLEWSRWKGIGLGSSMGLQLNRSDDYQYLKRHSIITNECWNVIYINWLKMLAPAQVENIFQVASLRELSYKFQLVQIMLEPVTCM